VEKDTVYDRVNGSECKARIPMKQPPSQVFRIFSGNRGSVPVRGSIVEMIQRAGFDAAERDTVYDRVERLVV
jgi:hypothetical protein